MWGHSWRWRALAAALPVWGALALPAIAQSVPADLPVTRLQGAGPASGVFTPPAPQPGPGPEPLSPGLPVTQLADRAAADLDGPRRIALSLARPMPLRDMLLLLVNGTPFSLVTDESVEGTFVGDLKNLTMRQALEAVLFPQGLNYEVDGSLIRVFAHKPETRLYDVNAIDQRRTWQRATRDAGRDGRDGSVQASGGGDRLEQLADGVRALLSPAGRIHVDRASGLVQVTDVAARLDVVGVYVEAVQLRALRQVRIDARVFDVTLNDRDAAGIDWAAAAARAGIAAGPARASGMTIADPAALIKAIAEQGTVTMLAAPHVIAMNNEAAMMRVGARTAYFETVTSPGPDGRPQRVSAPATLIEGLTLFVTPQLAGDGAVQLSVAPSYTEKTGEAKSASGDLYPLLRVSEADTVLRVRDGETIVLAGFLRDKTRKRPGTGLASYFGAESRETVTSELVILLTPVMVPSAAGAAAAR